MSFAPDNGTGSLPAAPAQPTAAPWWQQLADTTGTVLTTIPTGLWIAVAVITCLAISTRTYRAARRGNTRRIGVGSSTGRKALVLLGATIGSGFTIFSMWRVLDHQFDLPIELKIAFCALFEVLQLGAALNSRAFRLDHAAKQAEATKNGDDDGKPAEQQRPVDVDGIAVWVFAAISAVFCALDGTSAVESGMRLVIPFAVAWTWDRLIAGDLRHFTRTVRARKTVSKLTADRILVWLRLAEPAEAEREISAVVQDRLLAALAWAIYSEHRLRATAKNLRGPRLWIAERRVLRLRRGADAKLGLLSSRELMRDLGVRVAAHQHAHSSMSEEALRHLNPWTPVTATLTDDRPTLRVTSTVTGDASPSPATPGVTRAVTDGVTVTPSPGGDASPANVTSSTVTPVVTPAPSPAPRRTPSPRPRPAAVPKTVTVTVPATADQALALSRELVEQTRAGMSDDEVEQYAEQRARTVLGDGGTKVAAMHEYWLTCVVLGIEPKGTRMAKAVDGAESKGRTLAKKWNDDLAIGEAEQVLTHTLERIAAERAGDGNE